MKRARKEWQQERSKRLVDDFLCQRPIRVFDRYGRVTGERVLLACPKCFHEASMVLAVGQAERARFRCSKCGAAVRPEHEAAL